MEKVASFCYAVCFLASLVFYQLTALVMEDLFLMGLLLMENQFVNATLAFIGLIVPNLRLIVLLMLSGRLQITGAWRTLEIISVFHSRLEIFPRFCFGFVVPQAQFARRLCAGQSRFSCYSVVETGLVNKNVSLTLLPFFPQICNITKTDYTDFTDITADQLRQKENGKWSNTATCETQDTVQKSPTPTPTTRQTSAPNIPTNYMYSDHAATTSNFVFCTTSNALTTPKAVNS